MVVAPADDDRSAVRCSACLAKQRKHCYFLDIPPPTPSSISSGSIPLGSCLCCMAFKQKCVLTLSGNKAITPVVRCYGPIRASLLPIAHDRQPFRISLITATVPCIRQHKDLNSPGKLEVEKRSMEPSPMADSGSDDTNDKAITPTTVTKTCGQDVSLMLVRLGL